MDGRRRGRLCLALWLVASVSLAGAGSAAAQAALTSLDFKSASAGEIRQAAGGSQRARVTIVLAPDGAISASADAAEDIPALTSAVRGAVDAVLADHFGNRVSSAGALELTRADAHPVFTISATLAEVEALAADLRVRSVDLDFALEPSLADTIPLIGMPAAYAANATGAGFAVAIVDTGVDWTHQWFTGRLVGEGCFSGSGNPANSLCPGAALATTAAGSGLNCTHNAACDHGTHAAGIAVGSNLLGLLPPNGVARDGRLVAYKVFSGPGLTGWTSDITAALSSLYARRNSFGVPLAAVSLSLNTATLPFAGACDAQSPALADVIRDLRNAGIATVISAGNQSLVDQMTFPACIADVFSVANSTKGDAVAANSNFAAGTDLVAPGTSITAPVPLNLFGVKSGTSMAAPHVAGLIAALRSACGLPWDASGVDRLLAAMRQTGMPITDTRPGGRFTHPRIDGGRAAAAVCQPVAAPGNDLFAAAADIDLGETADANSMGAGRESGEPAHAGDGGGHSVWWRFEAAANASVTITTAGSSFDTLLAVYTGDSVDSLVEVAANNDAGAGTQSEVSFAAVAGATYRIAVDGVGGATGSIRLALGGSATSAGGIEPLSLVALAGLAGLGRRRRRV